MSVINIDVANLIAIPKLFNCYIRRSTNISSANARRVSNCLTIILIIRQKGDRKYTVRNFCNNIEKTDIGMRKLPLFSFSPLLPL